MRYKLTNEEIASYRENGFLVVDDFLNTGELQTWRSAIDNAVADRKGTKFPHSETKTGDDDGINENADFFGKVFDQIINLWQTDEKVKEIMMDKRLGEMAATLAQADGIRIWHDQSLIKRPWANPTAWHLDTPFWSFSNREALSIWVALDDVTVQNGCLYFMPGSHKVTSLESKGIGANVGEIMNEYPQYGRTEPVASVIKAGSCSFHNGLCLHAAGVNMTPGLRRAMTCAYMPDGSTFNGQQNIIPDDKFVKLSVGDLMNDNEQNPLIYHKDWA
jgi:ectoine hydroxylase-related dioxygenase (phytanoyl-CoA dioxygenase family)